jgi:hypothetical protein
VAVVAGRADLAPEIEVMPHRLVIGDLDFLPVLGRNLEGLLRFLLSGAVRNLNPSGGTKPGAIPVRLTDR